MTARIFAPERNEDLSDWSCKICIEGLATPFERPIFGVDSFQALELATSLLCTLLERHEASFAFLDGSPGDCALPLIASCPPSLKAEVRAFIHTKIKDDLELGQSALEQPLIAEITPGTDNVVAGACLAESISGTCVTARIFTPKERKIIGVVMQQRFRGWPCPSGSSRSSGVAPVSIPVFGIATALRASGKVRSKSGVPRRTIRRWRFAIDRVVPSSLVEAGSSPVHRGKDPRLLDLHEQA